MTNDDAKYREWWEGLKKALLEDQKSEDEVSDYMSKTIASFTLRRMLQIEAGK